MSLLATKMTKPRNSTAKRYILARAEWHACARINITASSAFQTADQILPTDLTKFELLLGHCYAHPCTIIDLFKVIFEPKLYRKEELKYVVDRMLISPRDTFIAHFTFKSARDKLFHTLKESQKRASITSTHCTLSPYYRSGLTSASRTANSAKSPPIARNDTTPKLPPLISMLTMKIWSVGPSCDTTHVLGFLCLFCFLGKPHSLREQPAYMPAEQVVTIDRQMSSPAYSHACYVCIRRRMCASFRIWLSQSTAT